jgi:hypothetical protein
MSKIFTYARVAHDEALTWLRYRHVAHFVTLLISIVAVVIPEKEKFLALVFLFLCETFAWVARYRATYWHDLSREGMRRAMVADGLGKPWDEQETQELRLNFNTRMRQQAVEREARNEPSHYTTKEPPGERRLLLNLIESAFWQKHLYREAVKRGIAQALVAVAAIVLTTIVVFPLLPSSILLTSASMMVEVLLFLTLWDELEHIFKWQSGSTKLTVLFERWTNDLKNGKYPILGIADYAAITATAPPVPSNLYAAKHQILDQSWKSVLESANQQNS